MHETSLACLFERWKHSQFWKDPVQETANNSLLKQVQQQWYARAGQEKRGIGEQAGEVGREGGGIHVGETFSH